MPGYADIGGSWRGLTGGGYANIGGSWRQITAGYQNRGGTWEKVFPNYADYGDIVDMFGQSLITNGYWRRTSGSAYKSTSAGSTEASTDCYLSNDEGTTGPAYHWFPTVEPIDLRGYNYLAAYIRPWYGYGTRSNRSRPFFALGSSADSLPTGDSTYILGDQITGTQGDRGVDCQFYLFVDLSNCTAESVYLKVGSYQSTNLSSTACRTYLLSSLIYLYKNKSDCDIDPGSTTAQYFTV